MGVRTVLGIAVDHGAVRGVIVQGGVVAATMEAQVADPPGTAEDIARAIVELFAGEPMRRRPSPAVAVAVGPAFAQLRRLRRLPPLRDSAALDRLVREGVGRFFVTDGVPLVTARVAPIGPGEVWAAAFDEPLVQAIERGCREAGLRLRLIAPAVAVLGAGLEDGNVTWEDGPVSAALTLSDGRLESSVRSPTGFAPAGGGQPRPRPVLSGLGPDGWRFAGAYGAATHGPEPELTIRPGTEAMAAPPAPRWRIALASAALAAAAATAVLAPGLAPTWQARVAVARIAAVAGERHTATVAEREIGRFTAVLDEVSAFAGDRRSSVLLLRALTEALPDGAALVSLRLKGTDGSVVALAPSAVVLVAALEGSPAITGARVTEPVTREWSGYAELERVTVGFDVLPEPLLPKVAP